jgi:hypothetical protein
LGIGIVITMLIKYLNFSTNPLWATTDASSGGWNKTASLLAAVSLYEYYHRPAHLFPSPPIATAKDKPIPAVYSTKTHKIAITLGLGSMIHLLQTFLMDAGTSPICWSGHSSLGNGDRLFFRTVDQIDLGILVNSRTQRRVHTLRDAGLGGFQRWTRLDDLPRIGFSSTLPGSFRIAACEDIWVGIGHRCHSRRRICRDRCLRVRPNGLAAT